LEIFLTENIR